MRNFTMYALVALVATTPSALPAGNLTGNDVLEACEAPDDSVAGGFCFGYVIGVVEGIKWGAVLPLYAVKEREISTAEANEFANHLIGYCAPDSVTYGQYVDVLKKFLQRNPETRHESARGLAQQAFSNAFPC